jgi:ATP-binding cassette subfamily F protein 3
LAIGYPGAPSLLENFSATFYRGDRIGLVGPNGCGKSTLMKTLLGRLPPLGGFVQLGHEVRVGYFDQKLSDLDEEHSLIDEIRQVRGDFNEDVARNFLGRFRFSGDDPFRKVKGLSGGERNRLALAKMMLRPRNLLALDEPTNHLDIPAREVLEEALEDYEGTVLVVSHDRYFLDRIVTKIVHLHDGKYEIHVGNYSDWRSRQQAAPAPQKKIEEAPKKQTVLDREERKTQQRELEKKQRRLADLENKIAAAEAEIEAINARLAADHGGDWQKLHGLVADKEQTEARLRSWMGEWEKLGAELESCKS